MRLFVTSIKLKAICVFITLIFNSSFLRSQPISLLKDLNQGVNSSQPNFVFFNSNTLIGVATDSLHGRELWISDGTEAGTVLVKDINNGSQGSSIILSFNFNGKYIFVADDGISGEELWVTDGTSIGTIILKDIYPGIGSGIINFNKFWEKNGKFYFLANDGIHGNEIWYSDGTPSGTSLLLDINPGISSSSITTSSSDSLLFEFQNELFFSANNGTHGNELWKTDGNSSGTSLVKDLNPGIDEAFTTGSFSFKMVDNFDGQFYFMAQSNDSAGMDRVALFASDGSSNGTSIIHRFYNSYPLFIGENCIKLNGLILFAPQVATSGLDIEIWRSNGTTQGTYMITDINQDPALPSVSPVLFRDMPMIGNYASFLANDGVSGEEIWLTSGDSINTFRLYDINPGSGSSYCSDFVKLNNNYLFTANDSLHGREIWSTDGTSIGTFLVKDVNPGVLDGLNMLISSNSIVNNELIFHAQEPSTGLEIWKTDGTSFGTQILKDLTPGPQSSVIHAYFTNFNNLLFFKLSNNLYGEELYRTDGSSTGTYLLKDISAGPTSSSPINIPSFDSTIYRLSTTINGKFIFSAAYLSSNDYELWETDGTANGTREIQDINPGTDGSMPFSLGFMLINGHYIFSATSDSVGLELWELDTAIASSIISSINQSGKLKLYPNPCVKNSEVELLMSDDFKVKELFVYDMNGKYVKTNISVVKNRTFVNTENFNPGVYLVLIIDNLGKRYSSQLIIN